MITYEMIKNAKLQLTAVWEKDGEKVRSAYLIFR